VPAIQSGSHSSIPPSSPALLNTLHLAPEIIPNSPLQLSRPLTHEIRQILQVVPSRDAKLAHEVLGGGFQIAVLVGAGFIVFVTAKVGIGGDGAGALEALQSGLGLGLRVGVEGSLAEELVRGDGFLGTEFLAGVFLVIGWCGLSVDGYVGWRNRVRVRVKSLPS
jgi:hypothetical protein